MCCQHTTTGDADHLLRLGPMALSSGQILAEARQAVTKCPQVLINVRFSGVSIRFEHVAVKDACAEVTDLMAGAALLRKSGTEPLVRVMVEGDDEPRCAPPCRRAGQVVGEVCA